MSMEEFHPTPHTPEIEKAPPFKPEIISGILPPKGDRLPGEDRPETNEDEDDEEVIIPPPLEDIEEKFPDDDERHDNEDLPEPTKH